MRVSVIIPNYNKEKYIQKCIESVLHQSFPDIEIIIVDDCSTDSSPKIIQQYKSKYPQIVAECLKHNGGVSHARNFGLSLATGYYVTMLDSDDFYYNPQKIENEVNILEAHGKEGIAYSYRQVVDENGKLLSLVKDYKERYISGNIFYQLITDTDSFAFVQRDYVFPKKYIANVGGYRESESYYEDFDLLLRLAERYPMYYTGENGTAYRMVTDGLSVRQKRDDAKQFRVPQKIKLRYMPNLRGNKKIIAYILWFVECYRLEVRIWGRRIKRFLGR